jgi:uroporphyrin-III C-methyltransferase/precorrin-2 dehydrogenase/sirohydrochlorin ferrochelatase
MLLFPLFVKLDGRACLVVGAGPIGESKIASLLETGATVTVVSPTATESVRRWVAEGRIAWVPRRFDAHDLDGMFLVVAAIPAGAVLSSISQEARRRGVLCNAVDDPLHCDFYYPAVVKRGDLQLAISTNGLSPALAQRIRKELEAQFGPEYEPWLEELGRVRDALFATEMDPEERKRLLHELASPEAFESYLKGSGPALPEPSATSLEPAAKVGKVFLIGAGPGDPELLTLKALRTLGSADVVLHDDLVPADVLELVPPNAQVRNVGKRHGEHHAGAVSQQEINALLIEHAAFGLTVVRLKGGDVSIFGRANEEIDALRGAGIDFEIVPGITAASAAAAAASVSLTDRRASSAVVLVTAQTCLGNARPDWRAIVSTGATLAIYMPGLHYDRIASELLSAGLGAGTPCLIVSHASQDHESKIETTVGDLSSTERLPAPAIVIVGNVVGRGTSVKAMSDEQWAMSGKEAMSNEG